MNGRGRRLLSRWMSLGQVAVALPLLAGCSHEGTAFSSLLGSQSVVRAAAPDDVDAPAIAPVAADPAPSTPPASAAPLPSPQGELKAEAVAQHRMIPICLDTVLRLAEDQNTQVGIARAKVDQACAEVDLAGKRWLPDLNVGTAYYRHEGGIQEEDGTLIHSSTGALLTGVELNGRLDLKDYAYKKVVAERNEWQQKGELSRITNETLLDATTTYVDLLTARTGEAIARDLEKDLRDLLPQAQKMAKNEPAAEVEVERIYAEIEARRQNQVKLRRDAEAASAKLVYLLGLDPCVELVPVDREIIPIDLVDVTAPVCDLVAQALANGPGIHELEAMVGLVEEAIQKSKGCSRLIPVVEVNMIEGDFAAGPGDDWKNDNRWDLGLHVRWNLTNLCTAKERMRAADAQRTQVHLAYEDLRGKLTAGVYESRSAIVGGREEINIGKGQIEHARKARELSKTRVDKLAPGATAGEVLLSLQTLAYAQLGHLGAVRDYDKAELRLMLLLGCRPMLPPCDQPVPVQGGLPKAAGMGQ